MNLRNDLFMRFESNIPFGTIIHSSCLIDKSVKLGKGTIIYPGCIIDMNTEIGNNCFIYNACNIAHDLKVLNNTIFSPGVNATVLDLIFYEGMNSMNKLIS